MSQITITVGLITATTTGNAINWSATITKSGAAFASGGSNAVTLTFYRMDGTTALTGGGNPITMTYSGAGGIWTGTSSATLQVPTVSGVKKCKVVLGITDGTNTGTIPAEAVFLEGNSAA